MLLRASSAQRSFSFSAMAKLAATALLSSVLVACGGDGSSGGNGSSGSVDGGGDSGLTTVQIGNGLGNNFEIGAIGVQNAELQSGGATQLIVNVVDSDGNAYLEAVTVNFSSNCIADNLASVVIEGDDNTTETGGLTAQYVSAGCSGQDIVTAIASVNGATIEASATINIAPDEILSVQFVEATPTQLSLRGVGGVESATVRFRLVGQQSAPIVGENVTFSLSTDAGGISLAETTAESNTMGEVTAIVRSGTVHTTVQVTATHDSSAISGTSAGIDISTGIPQEQRLSLSLQPANPLAWSVDGAEVEVNIISSDQFGNPVQDGTVVSFASPEAGSIPSSCTTSEGRCSVTWVSSDPRPVDGRLTIIAYTAGAENFTDNNGDAIFNDPDSFDFASMDLAEQYTDENENGQYDQGEFFFDFNNNGQRDVADGQWNGPLCEHASLCGADEVGIGETALIVMSTNNVQLLDTGTLTNPIVLNTGETFNGSGLILSDGNGNAPAFGTSISWTTTIGTLNGASAETYEIGSRTEARGPFGMSLTAPNTPGNGVVTMRVEVPDVQIQTFSWGVTVQ